MSQSIIVQKVKDTQQAQLSSLADEIYKCSVCRKSKSKLYICKFSGCDQLGRILCERCGSFTHDDEGNHMFEKNSDHIHEISKDLGLNIQNDTKNQSIVEQKVKDIHYMVKLMEDEKNSQDRNTFQTSTIFGFQGWNHLAKIGDFVPNDKYWGKALAHMGDALENGELKSFGTKLKTILFDVGDASLEHANVCKEGAIAAGTVLFAAELCYYTFKLAKGDISLKTYGKKIMCSIALSTGAAVGNIGGAAIGAAIGTYILPFVGTAICGALGGLLGAIFVGAKAKQSVEDIEWFNDKNEQKIRQQLIKEALDAFGFTWKQLKDKTVFNEVNIARKYRMRAKEAHPDRDGGSHEAFHKLNAQLSMLLALLQQNDKVLEETSQHIKAITFH